MKIVRLAVRLGYAVAREDLTRPIEFLRELRKNHRTRLIMMGYVRLGR